MGMVVEQWMFLQDISLLVQFARRIEGVMLTAGEFYESPDEANPEHLRTGQHPKRLAADFNLFIDGTYITGWHPVWGTLHEFWRRLSPRNRCGGDVQRGDYNHFERYEKEVVEA